MADQAPPPTSSRERAVRRGSPRGAGHGAALLLGAALLGAYALGFALSPVGSRASGEIEWVRLEGGTFLMGSDSSPPGLVDLEPGVDEGPTHRVTVPSFEMARTETTVAQYRACVEEGVCREPKITGSHGETWGPDESAGQLPVNKVSWLDARVFCDWAGGHLPSEAEWEYAARSGGQQRHYPWGDERPSCERAVFNDHEPTGTPHRGCGADRPHEVCSRPSGSTDQGLCDMGGNLWEWVMDRYNKDYGGAPTDGGPWLEGRQRKRMLRGAGFTSFVHCLRVTNRRYRDRPTRHKTIGFRCARSAP